MICTLSESFSHNLLNEHGVAFERIGFELHPLGVGGSLVADAVLAAWLMSGRFSSSALLSITLASRHCLGVLTVDSFRA